MLRRASIWGHDVISPGRSLTGPHERGVPWLYTESPAAAGSRVGRADHADGVLNVMRLLEIVPGAVAAMPPVRELVGRGDVDRSIAAPAAGFLVNHVEPLGEVATGDLLEPSLTSPASRSP